MPGMAILGISALCDIIKGENHSSAHLYTDPVI